MFFLILEGIWTYLYDELRDIIRREKLNLREKVSGGQWLQQSEDDNYES